MKPTNYLTDASFPQVAVLVLCHREGIIQAYLPAVLDAGACNLHTSVQQLKALMNIMFRQLVNFV